jgi:hypothetical protein
MPAPDKSAYRNVGFASDFLRPISVKGMKSTSAKAKCLRNHNLALNYAHGLSILQRRTFPQGSSDVGSIQLPEVSQVASSPEKLCCTHLAVGRDYDSPVLFINKNFGLV